MTQTQFEEDAGPAPVVLTLEQPVALVLLDLMVRLMDEGTGELRGQLEHPADIAALWTLKSALEAAVGETLASDYDTLVEAARAAVVAHLESGGVRED